MKKSKLKPIDAFEDVKLNENAISSLYGRDKVSTSRYNGECSENKICDQFEDTNCDGIPNCGEVMEIIECPIA